MFDYCMSDSVQSPLYSILQCKAYGGNSTFSFLPSKGFGNRIMKLDIIQSELMRLRKVQSKTRQDEVFGGLSAEERSVYEQREENIHALERTLFWERKRQSNSVA
jgi:hypothetical protein